MKKTQLKLSLVLAIILVLVTLSIFTPKRYDKNISPEANPTTSSQLTALESTGDFTFVLPHPEYNWVTEKNVRRAIEGKSLSGTSYTLEVSKPYDPKKILPLQIGIDLQNILKNNSFVRSGSGDGPFGSSEIYTKIDNENTVIDISMNSEMNTDTACKKEDAYDCLQEQKQFLNLFVSDDVVLAE